MEFFFVCVLWAGGIELPWMGWGGEDVFEDVGWAYD